MSETVIKVENLSKQYRLGLVGVTTISEDIKRYWAKFQGKEDPSLKIGHTNKLNTKITTQNSKHKIPDYVWALKNINFDVKQGDVLGIIGKNGAGKSTLLKILSKVTAPSTGNIKIKGRIASLLEVGTGFHAELTGRENIFLNGAILGMTKAEIKSKLDEIIDFSGVESYVDTPIKRYSSGMYVRLAFAVAAHLEPEILIVDEVLAVGDAEFQKKAIGKMNAISKDQGRTVLFVSHNMTAMQNLCKKGILLENGMLKFSSEINEVVECYLANETQTGIKNNFWEKKNAPGNEKIKIKSAFIEYSSEVLTVQDSFFIITEFWNFSKDINLNVSLHVKDRSENIVFNIITPPQKINDGLYKAVFKIPANFMNDGYYSIHNMFVQDLSTPIFSHSNSNSFEIFENRESSEWHGKWVGAVRPNFIQSTLEKIY